MQQCNFSKHIMPLKTSDLICVYFYSLNLPCCSQFLHNSRNLQTLALPRSRHGAQAHAVLRAALLRGAQPVLRGGAGLCALAPQLGTTTSVLTLWQRGPAQQGTAPHEASPKASPLPPGLALTGKGSPAQHSLRPVSHLREGAARRDRLASLLEREKHTLARRRRGSGARCLSAFVPARAARGGSGGSAAGGSRRGTNSCRPGGSWQREPGEENEAAGAVRKRRHGGGKRRVGGEHAALAALAGSRRQGAAAPLTGAPRHPRTQRLDSRQPQQPLASQRGTACSEHKGARGFKQHTRALGLRPPNAPSAFPTKAGEAGSPWHQPPGPGRSPCPHWHKPSCPTGTRVWVEPHLPLIAERCEVSLIPLFQSAA